MADLGARTIITKYMKSEHQAPELEFRKDRGLGFLLVVIGASNFICVFLIYLRPQLLPPTISPPPSTKVPRDGIPASALIAATFIGSPR